MRGEKRHWHGTNELTPFYLFITLFLFVFGNGGEEENHNAMRRSVSVCEEERGEKQKGADNFE